MLSSKQMQFHKSRLTLVVLLVALIVATTSQLVFADPEPANSGSNSADSGNSNEFGSPKRQYFIAPRIGRSPGGNNVATIWSALEEAALQAPGQVQAHRGFPSPLRSSLLFLVGNRRIIGPRSGGLLPQARIGRRAAPFGLTPQPRVGRRALDGQSSLLSASDLDSLDGQSELSGGQQEVAVATLSDSSFNDALESLYSG